MSESSIKILVVDDDDIFHFLVKTIVRQNKLELELHFAKNGKEALEKIPTVSPDVILLDLNMPVMNGWTFLENIQEDQNTFSLYVVSSSIDPREQEKALKTKRVLDFIEKPITASHLKAIQNGISKK